MYNGVLYKGVEKLLWVEFIEESPFDGVIQGASFRVGEHICPFV